MERFAPSEDPRLCQDSHVRRAPSDAGRDGKCASPGHIPSPLAANETSELPPANRVRISARVGWVGCSLGRNDADGIDSESPRLNDSATASRHALPPPRARVPPPGTRPGTRPGASWLSPRGRMRGSGVPSTRARDRDVAFSAAAAPGSTEMSFAWTPGRVPDPTPRTSRPRAGARGNAAAAMSAAGGTPK